MGTSSGLKGAANLSWKASAGATLYYVHVGTTAGGESTTPVGSVSATSTEVTGLKARTT